MLQDWFRKASQTEASSFPALRQTFGTADYVDGFRLAGLTVRRLMEPRLSAAEARGRAKHGYEEAFEQALTGLPAVIIWEVERRGSSP